MKYRICIYTMADGAEQITVQWCDGWLPVWHTVVYYGGAPRFLKYSNYDSYIFASIDAAKAEIDTHLAAHNAKTVVKTRYEAYP